MSKINWDTIERRYQAGVDHGVLYLTGGVGVPWNGLVSVTENPEVNVNKTYYLDGVRLALPQTQEEFKFSVSAFTYPEEFEEFIGYDDIYDNQPVKPFNFSYRTGGEKGQIHLVYNAKVIPSGKNWQTLSNVNSPSLFEWSFVTKPYEVYSLYMNPSSHIVLELSMMESSALSDISDILYGSVSTSARMPGLEELVEVFHNNAILQIVDNGDGTWTATGPDEYIQYLDATTFQITSPSVVMLSDEMYEVFSY